MKPFITPDISVTGQKVLQFQCEDLAPEKFFESLHGTNVVAYAMPPNHSLQAAWIFQLIFANDFALEFSSACTMVVGWQEVGSLNIKLIKYESNELRDKGVVLIRIAIPPFHVCSLKKVVYEDNDVRSECGLVFCGFNGEEIVVSTGVAPGSVSVAAPFSEIPFEPEFSLSICKREPLE